MWRSFFLAVGIGLMLLGVEALVFERVVVNESAKLPKFLDGVFEKDSSDSFAVARILPGQANPALQASNTPNIQRVPYSCLLYTSPSPRDKRQSRMPSSA